jgi:DnaJ family protein C protein 7
MLKQKKEEGNEVFKAGRFSEAYNLYTEALKIDPHNKLTNAKLFFNRATVCSKVVFEIVAVLMKIMFYSDL